MALGQGLFPEEIRKQIKQSPLGQSDAKLYEIAKKQLRRSVG